MTPLFTYEFHLDPDETVRATQELLRRQRFGWLHRSIWDRVIWSIVVAMGVFYFFLPGDLRALWLAGIAAFLLAALLGLVPRLVRRQLRRAYAETPSLRGVQIYQFSDAGLTIVGGATTITYGWDSFVEAAETTSFFLFYYSKRSAVYFPKRVVGDEPQLHRLRELIRLGLGERASGLRRG